MGVGADGVDEGVGDAAEEGAAGRHVLQGGGGGGEEFIDFMAVGGGCEGAG